MTRQRTPSTAAPWQTRSARSSAPTRPTFLDSRVTATTRDYKRFHDAVKDVMSARTLAGFHFRNSCEEGSNLGVKQPLRGRALLPASPPTPMTTDGPLGGPKRRLN